MLESLNRWPLENSIIFSIIVIVAMIVLAVIFHRRLQERSAALAVAILIPVSVSFLLNHVLALSREREQRLWALRQHHLEQLRPALRAEATRLLSVTEPVRVEGRVTGITNDEVTRRSELASRFYPHVLSTDLSNHFPAYWEKKERLREEAEEQDREHGRAVDRIMRSLARAPEVYRLNVARALVVRCMGLGAGMELTVQTNSYYHRWLGGGGGGAGEPPRELLEAFRAFTAYRQTNEVTRYCKNLKSRATRIIEGAEKLSAEAKLLAERTTLPGECEYTRLK